jgi:hypothetical protein
MATAEAQQTPRNWDVSRTAAGTLAQPMRRNPHDSASDAMLVVRRWACSMPFLRVLWQARHRGVLRLHLPDRRGVAVEAVADHGGPFRGLADLAAMEHSPLPGHTKPSVPRQPADATTSGVKHAGPANQESRPR